MLLETQTRTRGLSRGLSRAQDVLVRCPACSSVLQPPPGRASRFRCPCGMILGVPQQKPLNRHGASTTTSTRSATTSAESSSISNGVPPQSTPDMSRHDCELCHSTFSFFYRRHHCRNCRRLVCDNCSKFRWPTSMVPEGYNARNERMLRICKMCNSSMEGFREALAEGNCVTAKAVFNKGHVHADRPYSVFANNAYPIHCASAAGSIPLVQWLIGLGCDANVKDGTGSTPLSLAAQHGHVDLMRHLLLNKIATIDQVANQTALQECFMRAILQVENLTALITSPVASLETSQPLAAPSAPAFPFPAEGSQYNVSPPPAYSSIQSRQQPNQSQIPTAAPVPLNSDEEEEQLRIALAASQNTTVLPQQPLHASPPLEPRFSAECVVCYDNSVETCFEPCGHACVCLQCSDQALCPICRTEVTQARRIFLASSNES
mmetsp:Transcript_14795/g.28639  ORF Transcript_14795/g.28639 Transcript_14795/m.28639 type:complete len:434 (-) Transcript_14795:202-1503(-)